MARIKPVALFALLILVASFLLAIPQPTVRGTYTAPSPFSASNAALTANQLPTANFTFTPSNPAVNTTVYFDGHLSSGVISGWSWSWGDGSFPPLYSSSYQTHTFLLNGTFTVTLTVTDNSGQTAIVSANIKVHSVLGDTPPAPIFTYSPAFPLINQAVTFDASTSRDSDGDPVTSYYWYITDGTNLTQTLTPILTHTFVKVGVFLVTLSVADNHGKSSTSQVPAIIGVTRIPYVPGVAQGAFGVYSVSYNQPSTVQNGGQAVAAYQNVTQVSGTNVTINYSVRAPNGTTSIFQGTNDVRVGAGIGRGLSLFPFVTAANLIVGDPFSSAISLGFSLRINATVSEVIAGAQRIVNVASTQSPTLRLALQYDQATGLLVSYSFTTYGGVNSTVSLFLGDTNAWARTENAAPLPLFSWSPNSPSPGTLVSFDASHSYDPDLDSISYQWQFGDGNTATSVSPSHSYASNGIYNVTLTVSDLSGGTASSSKSILIGTTNNQSPIALFSFTPTNPTIGQIVNFDATSSHDPDGSIITYSWNFGDGQTGTGVTTAHTYSSVGTYNVALNVIDNGGTSGSVSHSVTIVPTSPGRDITLNQGEKYLESAVIDTSAGFAYFCTYTSPSVVVKVRLSDFTRVASLTLNAGENNVTRAVIDTASGFAYFGTDTVPGTIVKIRLSNFTRVGSLVLSGGENFVTSAVIDPAAGFAYFGTYAGAIVKIRLSNFTRVGSLTLGAPEYYPTGSVIDPSAGFAYFGTYAGYVVKVRLSDFTRVGTLALNPGSTFLTAVIDTAGGFAYFSTYTSPSIIVKVRLSDFTRVGSLTLNTGENRIHSAVIDTVAGFAYFGTSTFPGIVVKVRLSDLTRVTSLTLSASEFYLDSAVIDPTANFAYFGAYASPGVIIKVDLSGFAASRHTTSMTVRCTPSTLVINQATNCTATVTDTAPGPTTPTGTVTYPGGTCTLAGTGASATCSFDVTFDTTDTYSILASYSGDLSHTPSSGSTTVTVGKRDTTTTVNCTPATVAVNVWTSCTATVSDTSPGTVITPMGSVWFTIEGPGIFSAPTCDVSGTGASSSCSVSFKPIIAGLISVSADYLEYYPHHLSSGRTTVTVMGAPPDAPVSVTSSVGNGKVTINWSPPANDGGAAITGYNVYRATTSGGEALIGPSVADTSYADAGLTNGQIYYYKISAMNSVGEGPLSVEVTATPTSPPVSQSVTSGGVTFKVTTNSTISNLQYNAATHQISFQVSGIVGTGVANMTVPRSIVPQGSSFNVTTDGAASGAPSISQDANNYYVYVTYPSSTRTIYISFASPSTPENAAPNIFGLPPSIFTAILGAIGTIVSAIIGLAYRAKSKAKN